MFGLTSPWRVFAGGLPSHPLNVRFEMSIRNELPELLNHLWTSSDGAVCFSLRGAARPRSGTGGISLAHHISRCRHHSLRLVQGVEAGKE